MADAGFLDTHVHVDLYPDRDGILARAQKAGVASIVVTNRASEYRNLRETLAGRPGVTLGLGFHPEAAGSTYEATELEIFEQFVPEAAWIAEVGLDTVLAEKVAPYFGSVPTMADQERTLERILEFDVAGKPFSVHSRGAERRLVSMLEAAAVRRAVFHWFHGGREEAQAVLDAGYHLSVNPAMLTTDIGRDLCAWLPDDRLLLETDGPFVPWRGHRAEPSDLPDLLGELAALRGADDDELQHCIRRNADALA